MLFLDEKANEIGARLAAIGIRFLQVAFVSDRTGRLQRLPGKTEMATLCLAQIWSNYYAEQTLKRAGSVEARVLHAREALKHLDAAAEALKALPPPFLYDFFRLGTRDPEFESLLSRIDEMRFHARLRNHNLPPGSNENPVVRVTVHAIAKLYANLMERRFPKTLAYVDPEEPEEFIGPGAEFVRRILLHIDDQIDIAQVRTALRSFKSSEN
ncbi:hypothetical protein ELH27_01150 [Rhizobium leguminosarum]|uniref:hypothetical protein n=1 Tax=Rhizobium leguminosarum TaxID=384 RepID=UPI001030AE5E|nr:hypothetical protein [Rhizobium leguminosarum]TBC71556.1 hypothetical protein ELH27_01150 [Rhizobium leguminosarum]